MKNPLISANDIRTTVEKPDMMSTQCQEHYFYVKAIEGKGTLIVFAQKTFSNKADVICADWLQNVKKESEVEHDGAKNSADTQKSC